ncbi:hypothetical protein CK203_089080 [Vitis vinifera]|uniref:Wall-associated receptor kinase galacturonan-binding domain-containing protein n=1 Tax=Vitis vinifera TaxID=29760 RepID=A0A438DED5_VITVI|nr:hypothetical protein CK203_089080 [Vitis vinifera]
MMFREAQLVALALFHTFLLAICAANGNQTCRPSSCGEIQNISNPFRLKGDPFGCGDPDYELVCENNRTMVNVREKQCDISSSQTYVYALVGGELLRVHDIKYSCTILRTIATRFLKHDNLSMSDLQEVLLLGLDLSFLRFRCKSECWVKGLECDVNYSNYTVQCTKLGFFSYLPIIIRATLHVDRSIQYFGYLLEGDIIGGAIFISQLMGKASRSQ